MTAVAVRTFQYYLPGASLILIRWKRESLISPRILERALRNANSFWTMLSRTLFATWATRWGTRFMAILRELRTGRSSSSLNCEVLGTDNESLVLAFKLRINVKVQLKERTAQQLGCWVRWNHFFWSHQS